ncbi:MAG TPA: FAD-dependent oxidoreductase [Candidatus Saccharimonadales bacterium]|jgi:NADH dehydrogenase|nr:FAD-dependent oxidoreductase [Candidatus Saccharimonadales bacterium]
MAKTKVLVVGGGFGGVKAALELADDERIEVTLLSDDSDLRYYPTLYHTATGGQRRNSSIPLARIFTGKPVQIVQGQATTIDRKAKTVTTAEGQVFNYDSLILGLGVVTNYFGIPGLAEFSYSIKTQAEVARFKAHLHQQLTDERRPDLNYVIVGAGPTGIELAGALPAYLKKIIENHGLPARKPHIDLIEAMPRLLPRLPKDVSRAVKRRLKRLGITLYIGSAVQGETADELTINGKPVRSHTVIWTAGVTNHPFFGQNKFALTNRGKVSVDAYLQAEENIFVIGDNANTPFSGLAQTALHDGEFVAKNLKRRAAGKKFKSYVAKEPITVIPAGPHWAAVVWNGVRLKGKSGWLLREAADLMGFHDLEPWPKASRQFLTEFTEEDGCPICATATTR